MVQHARADMSFHADCWVTLHATVQAEYAERASGQGVAALLGPYSRTDMASWLPEAAIDEAVENLSEQLEQHLGGGTVTADARDDRPATGPVTGQPVTGTDTG